ncbi:hypothetical protein D0C36_19185 [Mucilaginibacter conchicola]|uniref:Uncharacterized protein n=1 Tax=Mucilaginibacter conchicola TaxID=2303333 RepID=A0A372NQD6_9SPHI|nr:hypothetical protein [Mucilaginibacter conchicola]RFZ91068.1 hypothetical protein D0C36_19185 [Mucilaginibacter conchicola]
MFPFLKKLGVSPELQAYFDINERRFTYGNELEVFGPDYHIVPVTRDLWMHGNYPSTELIITSCAMEAVAYMAVNAWRHPAEARLSFIAVGLRPHPEQLRWIAKYCLKRKITLVFSNDVCGRLNDIIIAAGIREKPLRAVWHKNSVQLLLPNGSAIELTPEKLSLNVFEKAASLRSGIRTQKPGRFNTFLDQLRYENIS